MHGNSFHDVVTILRSCAREKDVQSGAKIHAEIIKSGLFQKNVCVASTLVNMYAKCGALTAAACVHEELPVRNVVSWSALISGCTQYGQGEKAVDYYKQMQNEGNSPDTVTFTCLLKACGSIGATYEGQQIHNEIIRCGFLQKDSILGNALVDMYAKCGELMKASQVFDELSVRDVVSWNAIITGYVKQGQCQKALELFEQMRCEGHIPSIVTFACSLKACGSIGAIHQGRQIHCEILRQNLVMKDIVLGTNLVDMYAKCGGLSEAAEVFNKLPVRDAVTWTTLIAGYAKQGQGEEALNCFEAMQNEGLTPNIVTFISILQACGSISAANKGEQIHDEIVRQGLLGKDILLGNTLVDMYARCNALGKAEEVLNKLPVHNTATWNVLLAGYIQQGQSEEALGCYERMQREGIFPDSITFICILKACGSTGAANLGGKIHDKIVQWGLLSKDLVLSTTVVDMYAKCGMLEKAAQVLDEISVRDIVSWSALIVGYAQQGLGEEALKCFEHIRCEGLLPNTVTLTCVLTACCRALLLEHDRVISGSMSMMYGVLLDVEHQTCLVDFFGRTGEIERALTVVQKMPLSGHLPAWHALLNSCQCYGNVKLGKFAFDNLVHIDRCDSAAYVLMTRVAASLEEDVVLIEAMGGLKVDGL